VVKGDGAVERREKLADPRSSRRLAGALTGIEQKLGDTRV
jgi:hypothetical protein